MRHGVTYNGFKAALKSCSAKLTDEEIRQVRFGSVLNEASRYVYSPAHGMVCRHLSHVTSMMTVLLISWSFRKQLVRAAQFCIPHGSTDKLHVSGVESKGFEYGSSKLTPDDSIIRRMLERQGGQTLPGQATFRGSRVRKTQLRPRIRDSFLKEETSSAARSGFNTGDSSINGYVNSCRVFALKFTTTSAMISVNYIVDTKKECRWQDKAWAYFLLGSTNAMARAFHRLVYAHLVSSTALIRLANSPPVALVPIRVCTYPVESPMLWMLK